MTRDECLMKRRGLLRIARKSRDVNVTERCRTMATNLLLLADRPDDERVLAAYEKNRADFDKWAAHREGAGQ